MTFEPHRTPKLRLHGDAASLTRAARLLEAHFGPPCRVQNDVGWNLSRQDFERAERQVLADAAGAVLSGAVPGKLKVLLPAGEAAPTAFSLDGEQVRLLGYGRAFVIAGRQAQGGFGDRGLAGRSVRFAYYRAGPTSGANGRSSSSPHP